MSAAAKQRQRVPHNLAGHKIWAGFANRTRKGKAPLQPNGAYARVNDPSTWSSLDECLKAVDDNRWAGIGFMTGPLGDGTTLVAADFDGCFSEDDTEEWMLPFLDALEGVTWLEMSPSDFGLRAPLLVRDEDMPRFKKTFGIADGDFGCAVKIGKRVINGEERSIGIEVQTGHKFFTLTSDIIEGSANGVGVPDVATIEKLGETYTKFLKAAGKSGSSETRKHDAGEVEAIKKVESALWEMGADAIDGLDDLSSELRQRLEKALREHPSVRRRWENDREGLHDTTDSGIDMALAGALRRADFEPIDVALILLTFEHGQACGRHADDAHQRLRVAARTAARAEGRPRAEEDFDRIDIDAEELEPGNLARLLIAEDYKALAELRRLGRSFAQAMSSLQAEATFLGKIEGLEGVDWEGLEEKLNAASAPARSRRKGERGLASALKHEELPDLRWLVPDLIPEGLTLLVGPPKIGKSWLVLDIATAVAAGGEVLGKQTEQGDVLLLALEDGKRRLQRRLRRMLGEGPDEEWPSRLEYWTHLERLDEGGLAEIEGWIKAHPKRKAVIVDVLARVRSRKMQVKDSYSLDYDAVKGLQMLATHYGISVLLVHHTRKQGAATDMLEEVSGTYGLTGSGDGVILLNHIALGAPEKRLQLRGRDVEEVNFIVRFGKMDMRWVITGDYMPAAAAHSAAGPGERATWETRIFDILKAALTELTVSAIANTLRNNLPGVEVDDEVIRIAVNRMAEKGKVTKRQHHGTNVYKLIREG
jgi:hypothetical protein